MTKSPWSLLVLVGLLHCNHGTLPGPETPSGVNDFCQSNDDCDDGLVCVLEDEISPDIVSTCQSPCTQEAGGPLCVNYGVECWYCDKSAVPSVCRPKGCS